MEIIKTTIKFYPYKEWFWYFKKNKFLKGFTIRIFGINVMVKEEDSFNKLIHIGNIQRELRKNKISYK